MGGLREVPEDDRAKLILLEQGKKKRELLLASKEPAHDRQRGIHTISQPMVPTPPHTTPQHLSGITTRRRHQYAAQDHESTSTDSTRRRHQYAAQDHTKRPQPTFPFLETGDEGKKVRVGRGKDKEGKDGWRFRDSGIEISDQGKVAESKFISYNALDMRFFVETVSARV